MDFFEQNQTRQIMRNFWKNLAAVLIGVASQGGINALSAQMTANQDNVIQAVSELTPANPDNAIQAVSEQTPANPDSALQTILDGLGGTPLRLQEAVRYSMENATSLLGAEAGYLAALGS